MIEYHYDVDPLIFDYAEFDQKFFVQEVINQLLDKYTKAGGNPTTFTITSGVSPEDAALVGIRYTIRDFEICGAMHMYGACVNTPGHGVLHTDARGHKWFGVSTTRIM